MAEAYPELTVVLFNIGKGSNDKCDIPTRRKCMGDLLKGMTNTTPLFILCQEHLKNKRNQYVFYRHLFHTVNSPARVMFDKDNDDAGICYLLDVLPDQCEVNPVEAKSLTLVETDLVQDPKYENLVFKDRLKSCVLTLKNDVEKKLLLISWHGPHRRFDFERKVACFHTLIRFSEKLMRKESCDVVLIGGDFNLRFHNYFGKQRSEDKKIYPVLLEELEQIENTQVCVTGLSVDDRNHDVDYIVYWPVDRFHIIRQPVDVRPDDMRKKGQRPFDHPVLKYHLQFQKPIREVLTESLSSLLQHVYPQPERGWVLDLCLCITEERTENDQEVETRGSCLPVNQTMTDDETTVFQYFGTNTTNSYRQMKKLFTEGLESDLGKIHVQWYWSSVWKPLPDLRRISAANIKLFCCWCYCVTDVDDFPRSGTRPTDELLEPWVGYSTEGQTTCLLQGTIESKLNAMRQNTWPVRPQPHGAAAVPRLPLNQLREFQNRFRGLMKVLQRADISRSDFQAESEEVAHRLRATRPDDTDVILYSHCIEHHIPKAFAVLQSNQQALERKFEQLELQND